MVVLKTQAYGSPGTDVFATAEELVAAKRDGTSIYVISMVDRVRRQSSKQWRHA